jgi:anaerobic ribonucleoside-triphosphate reductase activating protein
MDGIVAAGNVLRVHLEHYPLLTLGPGTRYGLWLQGCSIRCEGCVSRETWDFGGGEPKGASELAGSIADIFFRENPDGLTVSGGEPFDQPAAFENFLREINSLGVRDVLIYSGYRIGDLLSRFGWIRDLAAAVVDGGFELGNETASGWRGSANQSLSVLRPEFAERYAKWEREKKGRLQILQKGNGIFVAGIPRQGDADKIRGM